MLIGDEAGRGVLEPGCWVEARLIGRDWREDRNCCAACLRVYLSCTTTNHELLITILGNYPLMLFCGGCSLLSYPAYSRYSVYGYMENIKSRPFTHPPSTIFLYKSTATNCGVKVAAPARTTPHRDLLQSNHNFKTVLGLALVEPRDTTRRSSTMVP